MAAMIIGGAFYGDLGCLILEVFSRFQQISTGLCLVLLDLLGLHWNHYRNLGMLMMLNESNMRCSRTCLQMDHAIQDPTRCSMVPHLGRSRCVSDVLVVGLPQAMSLGTSL